MRNIFLKKLLTELAPHTLYYVLFRLRQNDEKKQKLYVNNKLDKHVC